MSTPAQDASSSSEAAPHEPTSIELTFYGHACVGIRSASDARICVDPYRPGGFGGLVRLAPISDAFDYVYTTHDHDDHAAVDCVQRVHTNAATHERVHTPAGADMSAHVPLTGPRVTRARFAHDEFGGRLRGGFSDALRIEVEGLAIVHCGDLGEALAGDAIDFFRGADVLLVPVGGYYTIGPNEAARLVQAAAPRIVVPIHAREHGVALAELGSVEEFLAYFASGDITRHDGSTLTISQRRINKRRINKRRPDARPHVHVLTAQALV